MIDSIVKATYASQVIRAIESLLHYLFPERAVVEKLAAGAAVISVYTVSHQTIYFVKRCHSREGAQNPIQHRCAAPAGTPLGLYFSVNGHELGSIVKGNYKSGPAELKLIVKAMDHIKKIDVVKNGEIHLTLRDIESFGIDII